MCECVCLVVGVGVSVGVDVRVHRAVTEMAAAEHDWPLHIRLVND
jgi:hypothetical protein